MTLIMVISPQTLAAVVDLSRHVMKTQFILTVFCILTFASSTRNSRKSKTLPQCVQDEDCQESFCACCGECSKETSYRCKLQSGLDCQKKDMRVDTKTNKMTPEERAAGSKFFRRAMQYMNDTTFDWDKENP